MLKKNKKLTFVSLLLSFSVIAQAASDEKNVVVLPKCLISDITTNYKTFSSTNSLSLIETNEAGIDTLITAKNQHRATPCGGFIDVTEAWNKYNSKGIATKSSAKLFLDGYVHPVKHTLTKSPITYNIQYPNQVNQLLQTINSQDIWENLAYFSDTSHDHFPDRYAGSNTGLKAAEWLASKVETMAKTNNRADVTVYTVATGTKYKQPSVVVKIGDSNEPGIVIGGHMDTLSGTKELKPGADDDGSGSMTAMEVARILIYSGMHFKKPIYIIWYSAEELGLIGSGYVVKDFINKNIPVDAVLQLDMTGYSHKNDPTIWLITDNVDNNLTNYLETLINSYVKTPVGRTRCGYSCSDHASWNKAGFPAAFPFEADFNKDNPYIHTSQDTMDILSLTHMTNFAKLATAFAVELAEPVVE